MKKRRDQWSERRRREDEEIGICEIEREQEDADRIEETRQEELLEREQEEEPERKQEEDSLESHPRAEDVWDAMETVSRDDFDVCGED